MKSAAPDPRSKIIAQVRGDRLDVRVGASLVVEDSPIFDAGDNLFPPHACGGCGMWECNQTRDHAVWVRRGGASVFWLCPNRDIYSFDAASYALALGGDVALLPPIEVDAAERVDARSGPFPNEYTAPGGRLECRLGWEAAGPWGALRHWPVPAHGLGLVAPPAFATELAADEPGVPSIWLAREQGLWRLYAPGIVRLPTWVAGSPVDALLADVDFAALFGDDR